MHRFPKPLSLILLVTALFLTACGPTGPVEVAAILPLSGEFQAYGESSRKGLELALEELNQEQERFHIQWADSESDPATAATQFQALLEQKALVAIGGLTSREAEAMIPVAETHKRVLLSPSALSTRLAGEAEYFYRLAPSDRIAGNVMADFLHRKLKGIESVAVLAQDQFALEGFEQGFRPTFEANGGKVLEVVELPTQAEETRAEIARVIKLRPKAIYVAAYGISAGEVLDALEDHRYGGKILTDQTLGSPAALQQLGNKAVGVLFTQAVIDPETNAKAREFAEKYRAKYGEAPDIFAAEGYDALQVLAKALEDRPPYPGELKRGLRDDVKDFPGVTGSIEFNAQGSVTKYPRVYRVAKNLTPEDEAVRLAEEEERRRKRIEELRQRLNNQQRPAAG